MTAPSGAVWARVSTSGQEELSLDDQVRRATEELTRQGYSVDHILKETWSSEELDRSPKYQKLIRLVQDREVSAIAFLNKDRLPADEIERLLFLRDCREHAIKLIPCEGPPVAEGETAGLLEHVESFAKRMQVKRAQSGARQGLLARVRSRYLPATNRAFFGYEWNAQQSMYVPDQYYVYATRLWNMALSGETLRGIARRLTGEGVPTPRGGKAWAKSTVACILSNPAYSGRYAALRTRRTAPATRRTESYGKSSHESRPDSDWRWLPNMVERPTVTAEQFEQVQRTLERNRIDARRNSKREYLLRGRIVCGYCLAEGRNRKFYGVQPKHGQAVYSCSAHWGNDTRSSQCQSKNLPCAALEDDVKHRIRVLLANPDIYAEGLAIRASAVRDTVAQLESEIRQLSHNRDKTVNAESNLAGLLAAGRVTDEAYDAQRDSLLRRRACIGATLADTTQRLRDLRLASAQTDTLQTLSHKLRHALDSASPEDWSFIFDALDLRVLALEDGKWEVEVTLARPSGVSNCGRNSLLYFSLLTSCDSSTSRSRSAVWPTTFEVSSAERKTQRAEPRATM